MDHWYDFGGQEETAGDKSSAAERLEWRREYEARTEARAARVAAGGADWVAGQSAIVREREQELRRSPFWGSVAAALRAVVLTDSNKAAAPVELVCYGLGELDSISGSYQLALLLLLAAELQIAPGAVYCYDPVHTPEEEAVLVRCGCEPLRHDERGLRTCTVPTCFYMTHCPFPLMNNLIWANWAAPWRVSLIGNDLGFHALHNHPFKTVAPHLNRAMRVAQLTRLPDTFTPAATTTTTGEAPVSSGQIFGLSALYTFWSQQDWEGQQVVGQPDDEQQEEEADDPLVRWLREGRPELPTDENFAQRLEAELDETKARVVWLERRLQRERLRTGSGSGGGGGGARL